MAVNSIYKFLNKCHLIFSTFSPIAPIAKRMHTVLPPIPRIRFGKQKIINTKTRCSTAPRAVASCARACLACRVPRLRCRCRAVCRRWCVVGRGRCRKHKANQFITNMAPLSRGKCQFSIIYALEMVLTTRTERENLRTGTRLCALGSAPRQPRNECLVLDIYS